MKIALYAHGGSGNHGCEAIVRSTIDTIGKEHHYTLLSERPDEDFHYHLNDISSIQNTQSPLRKGLAHFIYKIRMRIYKDDSIYYKEKYRNFVDRINHPDIAIAIGGDNYCYQGFLQQFSVLNDMLKKKNIPIALWGCSIDPHRINQEMVQDLKKYKFITVRESITFQALKERGFSNIHLIPDTAFNLPMIQLPLPNEFIENNTVGINVSPLISQYESQPGMTMANYEHLTETILSRTSMNIALIPHVVWSHNDDRIPLKHLYQKYKDTRRVVMIEDQNAMILKGYISRCRFLIAARTHASIAGYSTGIPTLVVGYSVKAKGIATDLFGTDAHYVIPVDSLNHVDDLSNAFLWLMESEKQIVNHYHQHLSTYKNKLHSFRLDQLI